MSRMISYEEALVVPVGTKLESPMGKITRYSNGFGWTRTGGVWGYQPGLGKHRFELIPLSPEECDLLPVGSVVDSFGIKVTRVKGGWKRDNITWFETATNVLAPENYVVSNGEIFEHVAWVKKHFKPESPAYKLAEYIDAN